MWRAPSRSTFNAPTGCADRSQETINRGVVLVDTEGSTVGQINGLFHVLAARPFAFGRPTRITARVRLGSGRVTDIEREAKLGGLAAFQGRDDFVGVPRPVATRWTPPALAATLVFGAILLAGSTATAPPRRSFMHCCRRWRMFRSGESVWRSTGSVNQWGGVQAIGGVNEKIEGFFDVCRCVQGCTEQHGVLIPQRRTCST